MQAIDDLFDAWQAYTRRLERAVWDLGLDAESADDFRSGSSFADWLNSCYVAEEPEVILGATAYELQQMR